MSHIIDAASRDFQPKLLLGSLPTAVQWFVKLLTVISVFVSFNDRRPQTFIYAEQHREIL